VKFVWVVLAYLSLVADIARHVAAIAIAISATGVVVWALQQTFDWSVKDAIAMTAAVTFLLMIIGGFVFLHMAKG
jgi:hypothetical protein